MNVIQDPAVRQKLKDSRRPLPLLGMMPARPDDSKIAAQDSASLQDSGPPEADTGPALERMVGSGDSSTWVQLGINGQNQVSAGEGTLSDQGQGSAAAQVDQGEKGHRVRPNDAGHFPSAAANSRWGRMGYLASVVARGVRLPATVWTARRGGYLLPRLLTHTVTFGCNARCVMCDSWQLPTNGDLTLEEIERIYRQLPQMDAVRLTGGEPFVRQDMPQIYGLVLRHLKPIFTHISSNGFLTQRIVQFCETRDKTAPLELAISIDGVDDYHNHIRGSQLAFRSAWRTLTELAARRRELNLHLTVNQTVVDDAGLDQYETLGARLKELEVEHHLIVAYAESATYSLERDKRVEFSDAAYDAFAPLDPDKLKRVLSKARQEADRLPWLRRKMRRHYLDGVEARVLRNQSQPPRACQALHAHMRLFPNGDVPVCQFNSKSIGNLRSQSFQEVWKSLPATEERAWVRACQGCWAECEVAPNSLYTLSFEKHRPAK